MGTDLERYRQAEAALWRSLDLAPRDVTVRFGEAGTVLRVQELGAGSPVVLVHGGSASGANWAQLVPPLLARLPHHRLLLVDRPGCGLSEPSTTGDGIDGFRRFADAFVPGVLDALEVDEADVVATSMGGLIAIRSAIAHPERIRRMVQLAYCPGADVAQVPLAMRIAALPGVAAATARVPPNRMAVRAITRQLGLGDAMDDGRLSPAAVEWFHSLLRDTPTMRNELAATPELFHWRRGINPDVRLDGETLGAITTPMLFVWSNDDPLGGGDVAAAFAGRVPAARLELLDDASHAPWITQPDRCAELIAGHLAATSVR